MKKLFISKKGFDPAANTALIFMTVFMIIIIVALIQMGNNQKTQDEVVLTPLRENYFQEKTLRTYLQSEIIFESKYRTISEILSMYYEYSISNYKYADTLLDTYIKSYTNNFFEEPCSYVYMVKSVDPEILKSDDQVFLKSSNQDPSCMMYNAPTVTQVLPIYDYLDGQVIYVFYQKGEINPGSAVNIN